MHRDRLRRSDAVFCTTGNHGAVYAPGIWGGWAFGMQPQSHLAVCEPRASTSVYLTLVSSRASVTCRLLTVVWHFVAHCSVAKWCPTPWTAAGQASPVLHHLPELPQTHVHPVRDAIQPSHPLSSPSPAAFNLSQHQGLFQRVGSLLLVAKVLEL